MAINSVLLAGAGAVGLTVAHTILAHNPTELAVLAGGERLERYKEKGLFVNGKKLEVRLAPAKGCGNVHANPFPCGFDLIIIASKFHHLTQILDDMQPYVGEKTLILSLLNGISSEQIIAKRYGKHKVPLAMILGTDAQHSENHTTYNLKGVIHFGEKQNPVPNSGATSYAQTSECSKRVRDIAQYFERTGIAFEVPQDMEKRLWFKFMVNVGINQCSAVLQQPYGPFQHAGDGHPAACEEARSLMEDAMKEVIMVAQAEGIALCDKDIDNWYDTLDTLTPESRTSMCQDVMAKRKTEVELFSATVIELAEKHGIKVPVNQVLYRQLRTLEKTW